MENYTSLLQIKKVIKSGELMKEESFCFKGFTCWWADWDYRDTNSCDRLRCDPVTEKQYKDFELLKRHLEPKIIVDLS
jgi:hypothetical protein